MTTLIGLKEAMAFAKFYGAAMSRNAKPRCDRTYVVVVNYFTGSVRKYARCRKRATVGSRCVDCAKQKP